MNIIKNKSYNEYLKKYNYALKRGKVVVLSDDEIKKFIKENTNFVHKGKNYKLNLNEESVLTKNKKFYHINNKYYSVPLFSKRALGIVIALSSLIVAGGLGGGIYGLTLLNRETTANIKSEDSNKYVDFISEKEPIIGKEYKCEIKIKNEAKEIRFMPAAISKVTTGGVVLSEWHNDVKTTSFSKNSSINIANDNSEEPENYYTYTLNEDRSTGDLYIKKILGPVEIEFDLSNIKSIEISSLPYKTTYFVNQKFDPNGLKIVATDINNIKKEILDNDENLTLSISKDYTFTSQDISNEKQVTAIYKNTACTFNVSILEDAPIEIRINDEKCKKNFLIDEAINVENLIVEAKYKSSPNEWKELKAGYEVSPSVGTSFDESGLKNISISCPGCESKSYQVNVEEHTEMRIAKLPEKVVYKVSEQFSLIGLEMAVSKKLDGKRGLMSNRENKYSISSKSDIQDGYVFTENDVGHLKKIVIEHKNKSEPYETSFFVSVPLDCTLDGGTAFINEFSKPGTTYNAFRLTEEGLYDLNGMTYGGSSNDVMIVGSDGACFDAVSKEYSSEGYPVSWFSGLNIMICDMTFKKHGENQPSLSGLSSYNKAIYSNVTFNETYWYWGAAKTQVEGHTDNMFFNCTFNSRISDTYNDYAIYNYCSDLEFNNCTFNSNSRQIKVYVGAGYGLSFVTINNCNFKSHHTPFGDKEKPKDYDNHLINIKDVNAGYDLAPCIVSINNCKKIESDEQGSYHTKEYNWYLCQSKEQGKIDYGSKIIIDGVQEWPVLTK